MEIKKHLGLSFVLSTILSSSVIGQEISIEDFNKLKKEVEELKKENKTQSSNISKLRESTNNDNLKLSADFRTSVDMIDYKYADGRGDSNNVVSNRLIVGMAAKPFSNLAFQGALEYNKLWGNNIGANNNSVNPFQNFDWYNGMTPDDANLRVRYAYFLWDFDLGVPQEFSVGRRNGANGMLANYREDDNAASPIGTNVNMEIDGAMWKFKLDELTGVEGAYAKLCYIMANQNSGGKYSMNPDRTLNAPYTENNMDSASLTAYGIIAQLYNDEQYKIMTHLFKAENVMGFQMVGDAYSDRTLAGNFTDTGDMYGGAIAFETKGVGKDLGDFADNTILWASAGFSKTLPKGTSIASATSLYGMTPAGTVLPNEILGSSEPKTGYNIYLGTILPIEVTNGKLGLEYNHGSKYWRSLTYGEDTLIGSKLAARGDAYEIHYTQPLVGDALTFQVRYTMIDYKYTGSDGFFDNASGKPMTMDEAKAMGMNPVEKASDLRFYIRYRY